MRISIKRSINHTTTKWTGGTTTELFIHPGQSSYKNRDFNFRLSQAVIRDTESVFTSLPGVHRKLMVLEGDIVLTHEGNHSSQLAKFEVDVFEGDWSTSCIGSCTDLNLMLIGECEGMIKGLSLADGDNIGNSVEQDLEFLFLYNFRGRTKIIIDSQSMHLKEGDLLIVEKPEVEQVKIGALEASDLALVMIARLNK